MAPIKTKKRLGQHFLVDKNIAFRIVESIDPQAGDSVVEIGPGRGALTNILLKKECRVTAVEFDNDLISYLKRRFKNNSLFTPIAGDFLKFTVSELPGKIKLIGNIPYNITTVILEKLFEFKKSLQSAVFTVQSEVADRLAAIPGSRASGSFTMIMKAGFDIECLFKIQPKAFKPAPAVSSTVIRLKPVTREPENFANFKAFIRGCYKQKRKTLSNSMQLGLNLPKKDCESLVRQVGKPDNTRPEQLSFEDYLRLYELWRNLK